MLVELLAPPIVVDNVLVADKLGQSERGVDGAAAYIAVQVGIVHVLGVASGVVAVEVFGPQEQEAAIGSIAKLQPAPAWVIAGV